MADDNDDQQVEETPAPVTSEPAKAVTDRPADVPSPNTTLADRAKARATRPATKVVDDDDTENKAVTSAAKKAPSRRKG